MAAVASAEEGDRGRLAQRPTDIPKKGWRDILLRVKQQMSEDNLSIIAAGVAFYALLSALPFLFSLASIYGLVFDPAQVFDQIKALSGVLPREALDMTLEILQELTRADSTALGLGAAGGVLLALWTASAGVRTMMEALNVAYDEEERRGFFKRVGISLLLTLAAVVAGVITFSAVVLLPAVVDYLGLGDLGETLVKLVRWPILAVMFWAGLVVMYRYGPSRDHPRWNWAGVGAMVATVLWIIGSALFSFYVSNFASYNKTYGSMGAVVILLMWLLITAYLVLIGAEVNAETERQTKQDTTVGAPKPMGQRNAYAADTVGPTPPPKKS